MKICVTSEGDDLDSKVDPRFGRCQYFMIVDEDYLQFEVIRNPNVEAMSGVGVQSAQLLASKQVETVLTGNVGPNALQTLQAAGINVFTGVSGTVKEAIERYRKGEFKVLKGISGDSKGNRTGS